MRFSLRTKILLPILGIVALALTVSLYFVIDIAQDTIIESSEKSLRASSLSLKNAVLQEVGRAKADVKIASTVPAVHDVLEHIDYPFDSLVRKLKVETANDFLQSMVTIFGYYESFYLTNDKGLVATSAFSNIVNKLDISNRDWFHASLKANGPVTLSDPFVSRFSGHTLISQAMRINIDERTGVVVGVLRLQQMLQIAFKQTQTDLIQTLLVDQDGLILAKFTNEDPLTKKDTATLEAEQITHARFKNATWLQFLQKSDTGVFTATIDNEEKIVSFDRVDDSQMYSLALATKADLLAPAKRITNVGQIILVVSLLLSCLVIFFVVAPIVKALQELGSYAESIGNGEFEKSISIKRNDELSGMANSLVQMSDNLQSMIITAEAKTAEAQEQTQLAQQAQEAAEQAKNHADAARRQGILHAASQLSEIFGEALRHIKTLQSAIEEATQGIHTQQDRIEETSNAIVTLNTAVGQILDNSSQATEVATQTINNANSGAKVVSDVAQSVEVVNTQVEELRVSILELNKSAQGISGTLSVISDIADQTNLLALNAAIEAARAGDAGRGFAVVADEVRKLADNTMVATREIHNVIQEIQKQAARNIERMDSAATSVEQTVGLASIAATALQEIVHFADSSVSMVSSITDASRNQSVISKKLEEGSAEINDVANANTQYMNRASEAVYSLDGVAKRIEQLITELQKS